MEILTKVLLLTSLYFGERWNMEKSQDFALSEEKDALAE